MHWQGLFNVLEIDTTPGGRGPFAPPPGWDGTAQEYMDLMKLRYRDDRAAKQQMLVAAKLPGRSYYGPYAAQAEVILHKLGDKR